MVYVLNQFKLTYHVILFSLHMLSTPNLYTLYLSSFFLTAIWLPYGRLWAIIEGQPHSPDVTLCVLHFRPDPMVTGSLKITSVKPEDCLTT